MVHVQSIASIFWIAFNKDRVIKSSDIKAESMEHYKKLHRHLLENGVYFGPSGYEVGYISAAHTKEDLDKAIEILHEGFAGIEGCG